MLDNCKPLAIPVLLVVMMLPGCGSGKDVLMENADAMKEVRRVALVGFPGQCTHEGRETPFLTMSNDRFNHIGKFRIVPRDSVDDAIEMIGFPEIRPGDDFSALDVRSLGSLCNILGVDAVVVGFYRSSTREEASTSPVAHAGNVTLSVSQTYVQTFPTFDVCIIGENGSLLFRGVAEGRKADVGGLLLDSIVRSESDETFYQRVEDALDGICGMVEKRL